MVDFAVSLSKNEKEMIINDLTKAVHEKGMNFKQILIHPLGELHN